MGESAARKIAPDAIAGLSPGYAPRPDRLPVSHHAVETIQQLILNGTWRAGDRLPSQRDLAEQLSLSRNSLREALSVLETLGYLRIEPGRGVFVMTPEQRQAQMKREWRSAGKYALEEVYQMRYAIEGMAAMLLAPAISREQLSELQQIVAEMREAAVRRDMYALSERNTAFHFRLLHWSGNRMAEEIGESLRAEIEQSNHWAFADQRFSSIVSSLEEIELIVHALADADPDKARLAVEQHIRYAAQRAGINLGLVGR
ncbi:FadR/GntR family transcriptional regulator [Burkholderia pseudomultivorans]|uniref:HTH-type transcriptional regulator McbR n=1 Tax=Burkholderia pseudomultivorans TaxID=1207504 RepID=A0ABU2EDE8_9BURK|nr:FCD domain-containing protein [Burkholderia pseudomultivorans]MDR8731727.1 HTH-type transcriptional regulator McbR [Burkholderia pseudomultivorans]MDR8739064.1 HTH-type transcriptional regulator McbR [Burkholderia pseudomultivorans]MDR8745624.1 HTH-type transcriptional regulator McbR [Burkholderia pseudomultivorans]MDR8757918.1 HTH-type transcriptional regulator McbR [Burkholderia pseudomultivorans]MDR8781967.1 HTH-type transcriptional regulator McbR [Burkholderia pseudomultivorans]